MYLVLAPAESTLYLYAYAIIENIEILDNEKSTKVTFCDLRRFVNDSIPKTELIKTNGTPVDINYIRSYLLCKSESIIKYLENEPVVVKEIEEYEELLQIDFSEGTKKSSVVNRYERNREARNECIKHYGAVCCVCGFNFEKMYGEIGKGFIHVHHELDISLIGKEYKVDPIRDLKPVCPNCHAMLHQKRPAYTVDELKSMLKINT